MNHRTWLACVAWIFTALLMAGCDTSNTNTATDGNDNTNETPVDVKDNETEVFVRAFIGLGPLASGSTVEFFELDPMTGQRTTGDAAATISVDDTGALTLPNLNARWIEAVANDDYLDLYANGGNYTSDAPVRINAILDTEDDTEGKNVQLFTHLVAERARWLLLNSESESVAVAMARATQEFSQDWALNLAPEALHFFFEPEAPVIELDDYAKLLAASSYISRYIADATTLLDDLSNDYAQARLTRDSGALFEMTTILSTQADVYSGRAISSMGQAFRDEDRPNYWQLYARTLSGCEAAKAFSSRTIVCLGEDRDTVETVIPSGDGTYTKTLYFHPRATGMWALEVSMQERCDVNWTSYLSDTGSTTMAGDSTTDRSMHKLVSGRRMIPALYRLEVRFDRDNCSAQSAQLNFRKVSTGSDSWMVRGLYFLEKGGQLNGVVGNYDRISGDIELSSSRAYMFYANTSQSSSEIEFTLDFDTSGAVQLDLHVEEFRQGTGLFGNTYIGIGYESQDNSVGQLKEVYTLKPLTLYRIWVENKSADTVSSLNDFRSTGRRSFELTLE